MAIPKQLAQGNDDFQQLPGSGVTDTCGLMDADSVARPTKQLLFPQYSMNESSLRQTAQQLAPRTDSDIEHKTFCAPLIEFVVTALKTQTPSPASSPQP